MKCTALTRGSNRRVAAFVLVLASVVATLLVAASAGAAPGPITGLSVELVVTGPPGTVPFANTALVIRFQQSGFSPSENVSYGGEISGEASYGCQNNGGNVSPISVAFSPEGAGTRPNPAQPHHVGPVIGPGTAGWSSDFLPGSQTTADLNGVVNAVLIIPEGDPGPNQAIQELHGKDLGSLCRNKTLVRTYVAYFNLTIFAPGDSEGLAVPGPWSFIPPEFAKHR